MMRRLDIAVLLILWCSLPGYAEEGFFSKTTLPPQLLPAWEATFLILYRDGASGTAFVIDKQPITARRARLLFLTGGHMVQGHCQKPFGYCRNIESLSASEGFHRKNNNAILMNHRGWTIREAAVIDYDLGNDLALLEAIVDRDKYQDLQPIPRLSNCSTLKIDQPLYVIGFPDVFKRTAPDALPIDDKEHVIRRWSRGIIVGRLSNKDVREGDQDRHYRTGTTADAIFGNSGGPALTSNGEFFGVSHAITVVEPPSRDAQNPFNGNDETHSWHSNFASCHAIADFLSR